MTDIAHIIQVELDRLNHSGEAFANYGRHIAAALSRLAAPPPEEIAGLADRLELGGPNALEVTDQAAAALRSLAQQNKALDKMAYERWEIAISRIRELEAERNVIKERAIEANAANLETIGAIRAKTIEECAKWIDQYPSLTRIAKEIRALKPSEGKSVSYDSVSPDEAAEYVRKERERNANRDKSYPVPSDGFINDYD